VAKKEAKKATSSCEPAQLEVGPGVKSGTRSQSGHDGQRRAGI